MANDCGWAYVEAGYFVQDPCPIRECLRTGPPPPNMDGMGAQCIHTGATDNTWTPPVDPGFQRGSFAPPPRPTPPPPPPSINPVPPDNRRNPLTESSCGGMPGWTWNGYMCVPERYYV